MPNTPTRSQIFADEHRRHAAYHGRQTTDHDAHQEPEAAARHRAAAAHEEATTAPHDDALSGLVMRARAIADEVSQLKAGERR